MNTRKLFLGLTGTLLSLLSFAQMGEYRSSENPYYWKNRKPFEGYWQQDVHYKIDANVNDETDVVSAELQLTYYNNSPDTLYHVFFNLFQNGFLKGGYLEKLNRANHFYQRFGKYETAGKGTEILELKNENGTPLIHEIDFSIMKVKLDKPILPNTAYTFNIKFNTYFDDGGNQRRRMKTFNAYGYKHYDGVHWYPRICVYDTKFGWHTDQHIGKEFYGNFGTYEVALTFPNNYVMDATGVLVNPSEVFPGDLRQRLDIKNFANKPLYETPSIVTPRDGTTKTWKFRAINVHDFAWTADPTYRIGEVKITLDNGTEVSCVSLAQEPHAKGWQDAALFNARVIQTYSRDFGNYAYPKMIVADARDGMEYPMLTLDNGLSPGYYNLLAHEIGHNWFMGMLGSNETYRAFMDEGFTQFLTNWAMTDIFGETKASKSNPYPMSRMDQTVYWGYIRDAIKWEDMPLNTHSDDFNGALHHGGGYAHVYYKGATMLYNLQYVLGDKLFIEAMQHYVNKWQMAHPYPDDFRKAITEYTKTDLTWFFDQWIETTKRIDYSIDLLNNKKKKDSAQIVIRRKGEMQMPIGLTVTHKDGSKQNYWIPNNWFVKETDATVLPKWTGWGVINKTYTAQIPLNGRGKIVNVEIDTTYRLADVYQVDNSWRRNNVFVLDRGRRMPPNRKYTFNQIRPDLWYNGVDGLKVGFNGESDFLGITDVFNYSIWYNTGLLNNYDGPARNLLDFRLYTRKLVAKKTYSFLDARSLDGISYLRAGVDFQFKKSEYSIYLKFFGHVLNNQDYRLNRELWMPDKANSTINIKQRTPYKAKNITGEINWLLRSSFASDYDFSSLAFEWLNNWQAGKGELRTRVFAQVINGSNIAPESRLFVAGASPEDLLENKYTRATGFVPNQWLGYGAAVNHFHAGGGLNVRGYAGYLLPRQAENNQVFLFSGNGGAAINAEFDVDGYINLKPRKLSQWLHVDLYLFGDAGILSRTFVAGEQNFTANTEVNTGIIANAGTGAAVTIKKFGSYNKAKPLTLRFDVPWVLSNTPFIENQFVKFRWVVGINRSF